MSIQVIAALPLNDDDIELKVSSQYTMENSIVKDHSIILKKHRTSVPLMFECMSYQQGHPMSYQQGHPKSYQQGHPMKKTFLVFQIAILDLPASWIKMNHNLRVLHYVM